LVELCLLQLASLTFEGEKKNSGNGKFFVIPPSYFKKENPEKITSAGSIEKKPIAKVENEPQPTINTENESSEEISAKSSPLPEKPVKSSNGGIPQKVIERPQILAE